MEDSHFHLPTHAQASQRSSRLGPISSRFKIRQPKRQGRKLVDTKIFRPLFEKSFRGFWGFFSTRLKTDGEGIGCGWGMENLERLLREAMEWWLSLLSYIAQNHLPRAGTAHLGLGPLTSVINQENTPQTCPWAKLKEHRSPSCFMRLKIAFSPNRCPYSGNCSCHGHSPGYWLTPCDVSLPCPHLYKQFLHTILELPNCNAVCFPPDSYKTLE